MLPNSFIVRPASTRSSARRRGRRNCRSTRRIASTARPATSRTRRRTSTGSFPREVEVRIIRTCRLAVGAVSGLLLASAPAVASRAPQGGLLAYVRARAAGSLGADDRALRDYSASLAFSPGNKVVATGALRQALAAGERDLAVKAARTLEQTGAVSPDVRFVLVTESVRTCDWAEANRNIDLLANDQVFAFVVPVLRAWVAVGSRQADPIAILHAGASDQLAGSYIAEHRPLILLALGREPEGLVEVRNRSEAHDTRTQRLVVSAAARLVREGKRDQALALLGGDEPAIANARGWLEKHDRLPGEIATPAQGVAEFFLRIAIDLRRQDVGRLAGDEPAAGRPGRQSAGARRAAQCPVERPVGGYRQGRADRLARGAGR